jgi:hypothetical protein
MVFWYETTCILVYEYQHCRETCYLHLHHEGYESTEIPGVTSHQMLIVIKFRQPIAKNTKLIVLSGRLSYRNFAYKGETLH